MKLVELPTEVLDLICEAIFDDEDEFEARVERNHSPNLFNLALTCRQLSKIAIQWVQREVRIRHPSGHAKALLQRLAVSPSDGDRIRALFITNQHKEYVGDPSELDFLIKTAVNLHDLYVPQIPARATKKTLMDKSLECAKTLENICLDASGEYSIDNLFHLLSFPRLRGLQIFRFDDHECRTDIAYPLPPLRLKNLRLTSCQIGMPLFDKIMSRCSKIQELEILLPLPGKAQKISDSWDETWASPRVLIDSTLSMVPISLRLEHFRDSLVELHLLTGRQVYKGTQECHLRTIC